MPFYVGGAGGLAVNGKQVIALEFKGQGVNVSSDSGTVTINGLVVNDGSLTVANPVELFISGSGAVLTEGAVVPRVVQSATGTGTFSLPNPTTAENLLLLLTIRGDTNPPYAPGGYTVQTSTADNTALCSKVATGGVETVNIVYLGGILVELSGVLTESYASGVCGSSGGYTEASIAPNNPALGLVFFCNNSNAYATPLLPAGADIVASVAQRKYASVVGASIASGAVTFGATGAIDSSYYQAAILYGDPTNITANLSIT